jgi:hypothetical protein
VYRKNSNLVRFHDGMWRKPCAGGSGRRAGHVEEAAWPWAAAAGRGRPGVPAGAPADLDWPGGRRRPRPGTGSSAGLRRQGRWGCARPRQHRGEGLGESGGRTGKGNGVLGRLGSTLAAGARVKRPPAATRACGGWQLSERVRSDWAGWAGE